MSLFSEVLPQWENVGVEPSGAKKTAGWQLNEKPPAEWFNWLFHRGYKCMEEIQSVVDALATSSGAANVVVYGASATGNDSYSITPNPAILGYSAGLLISLKIDVGNTGTATLNVSSKGVKNIKKLSPSGKVDISTGDMLAGGIYGLFYDGTDFVLTNPTQVDTSLYAYQGDILVASGANAPTRLGLGSADSALVSNGSNLVYGYPVSAFYTASNTEILSRSSENMQFYDGSGSYYRQFGTFRINRPGRVRVKCEVWCNGGNTIKVAGSTSGDMCTTTFSGNGSYQSITMDFTKDGTTAESFGVQVLCSSGWSAAVRNISICASVGVPVNSLY